MKIAMLSDIHANIDAFNAVLEVIDRNGVEKIYVAGDLVGYYYHADKVIDICMTRDDIHCIRGNHERNFLDAINDMELMDKFTKKYGSSYALTQRKLTAPQLSWLKDLPTQLIADIDGVTLTIAHGSIYSEDEYVYPTMKCDELTSQLSDSDFTVLGHTHHPFVWCKNNKFLVNPGSVGQPRDQSALSSFICLDTSNYTLLPYKVKFSVEQLKKDVAKFDPNNQYLTNVLTR